MDENRVDDDARAELSLLDIAGQDSDEAELSWQEHALCAQTDPEAVFPEKGGSTREAKKGCVSCEVRAECLEYALEHDERFVIWGGLSELERHTLKRREVSPPRPLNYRQIAVVDLVYGTPRPPPHEALRRALADQTHRPVSVVVIAPSDLPAEVREAVEAGLAAGAVGRILPVSAVLSRAGAVRETLEALESGERTAAEVTPPAAEERAAPARSGGRRARDVDSAAVERERTQRAEDLAKVPQRLRRERYRSGRRVGAADPAGDGSWLWFVMDGAPPAPDAL